MGKSDHNLATLPYVDTLKSEEEICVLHYKPFIYGFTCEIKLYFKKSLQTYFAGWIME